MPDSERPEGIAQCSGVIKSRQNDKSVLRTVKGQRVLLPAEYCSCGICLLKDCYIVHEDLLIPFPFCISVNGKIKTVVIDPGDFYGGIFPVVGISVISVSRHVLGRDRREVALRPVQPEPRAYGIPCYIKTYDYIFRIRYVRFVVRITITHISLTALQKSGCRFLVGLPAVKSLHTDTAVIIAFDRNRGAASDSFCIRMPLNLNAVSFIPLT